MSDREKLLKKTCPPFVAWSLDIVDFVDNEDMVDKEDNADIVDMVDNENENNDNVWIWRTCAFVACCNAVHQDLVDGGTITALV